MRCKHCGSMMQKTFRFSKERNVELEVCPSCHSESKPVPIKYDEFQRKENTANTLSHKESKAKTKPKLKQKLANNPPKKKKNITKKRRKK